MKTVPAGIDGLEGQVEAQPHYKTYFPLATTKCRGVPLFRSQFARDYACLLDLDIEVSSWLAFTNPIVAPSFGEVASNYYVDFKVTRRDASSIVDVYSGSHEPPSWIQVAAEAMECRYEPVSIDEFLNTNRLQNAKDLLRYGRYCASLGDRIRLLAALNEMGTLTLAECLGAVQEGKPMPTIASLILDGAIAVDLEADLLGPDTAVRVNAYWRS